ncbi:response regulator [Brumimicrobium mesophilum]|uniref:response regulator n=1 Tax=Brumimicrobium mesophilum TaxID=392717 RepID=UPI000D1403FD|nr:response regulator [Brumimicrobium mesophilum]
MLNHSKICVLIDDDEDDQLIFKTVMNMHFKDYQFKSFSNFENATAYILNNHEEIEALFIDLNMPKSNGIDCLNFLRKQSTYKDKPIIIYSTSNNPDDAKKCLIHGATAFMTKPSRVNELVEKLSEHLKLKVN